MSRQMVDFGFLFILMLVIALLSVYLAFQPAVIKYEVYDDWGVKQDQLAEYAPNTSSYLGMGLRGRAWLEYPQYNIGLGVIAFIGFAGAIYAASGMYKVKGDEVDTKD